MEPRWTVQLTLKAHEALLPLATGFVEKAASVAGLGSNEGLALTLATEEVFLYLCRISAPGSEVGVHCRASAYRMKTDFLFDAAGFQLRALNLTASSFFEGEADTRETGLRIASRLVDRFNLKPMGGHLLLTFIKDKRYPEMVDLKIPEPVPMARFFIRQPDGEETKTAVRMIRQYCPNPVDHSHIDHPGKVADIVASGELDGALAVDEAGHVGGVLFWTQDGTSGVECFGPYIFHPRSNPEIAAALLDRCMEEIARSGAVALINRFSGSGLPPGYFETLGTLTFFEKDGTSIDVVASYRELREDRGMAVWAHPDLIPFLESHYDALTLPRDIQQVTVEGEETPPISVLSTEMDRFRHRATLRPLRYGENAESLLAEHVRMLQKDGFAAIFFEMDLMKSWQAHFTPCLLRNGFTPRLVLPYGASGDLVVFQHGTHGRP